MLELIEADRCLPALVVGMLVGFVSGAESKEMLTAQVKVPYITIRGCNGSLIWSESGNLKKSRLTGFGFLLTMSGALC